MMPLTRSIFGLCIGLVIATLPTLSLARGVLFRQDVPITVTPIPASDVDWDMSCDDGMTPYHLPIDIALEETGVFHLPFELNVGPDRVIERRGSERSIGTRGLGTQVTLPEHGVTGKHAVNAPVYLSGTLHVCVFRKNVTVVGGDLVIEGTLGVWSIPETHADIQNPGDDFDVRFTSFETPIYGAQQRTTWGTQKLSVHLSTRNLRNGNVRLGTNEPIRIALEMQVSEP